MSRFFRGAGSDSETESSSSDEELQQQRPAVATRFSLHYFYD